MVVVANLRMKAGADPPSLEAGQLRKDVAACLYRRDPPQFAVDWLEPKTIGLLLVETGQQEVADLLIGTALHSVVIDCSGCCNTPKHLFVSLPGLASGRYRRLISPYLRLIEPHSVRKAKKVCGRVDLPIDKSRIDPMNGLINRRNGRLLDQREARNQSQSGKRAGKAREHATLYRLRALVASFVSLNY